MIRCCDPLSAPAHALGGAHAKRCKGFRSHPRQQGIFAPRANLARVNTPRIPAREKVGAKHWHEFVVEGKRDAGRAGEHADQTRFTLQGRVRRRSRARAGPDVVHGAHSHKSFETMRAPAFFGTSNSGWLTLCSIVRRLSCIDAPPHASDAASVAAVKSIASPSIRPSTCRDR